MSSMNELKRLAQRAMRERGFLPQFSAQAIQQANSVSSAPTPLDKLSIASVL